MYYNSRYVYSNLTIFALIAINVNWWSFVRVGLLGSKKGEAFSLLTVGDAYFLGKLGDKAIDYHRQAAAVFKDGFVIQRFGMAGELTQTCRKKWWESTDCGGVTRQ